MMSIKSKQAKESGGMPQEYTANQFDLVQSVREDLKEDV